MIELTRQLRALGKPQKELGALLGIGQSRVSDLMQGKAKLFSLDMLLSLAEKIGMKVKVEVEKNPASPEPHSEDRRFGVVMKVGQVMVVMQGSYLYQANSSTSTPSIAVKRANRIGTEIVPAERVTDVRATNSTYDKITALSAKNMSSDSVSYALAA